MNKEVEKYLENKDKSQFQKENVKCQYCDTYYHKRSVKQHEKYCKQNPNRIQKAKLRKEPLDYETLNKNIEKCQYCNQEFHPSGLPNHEAYCQLNPNRKNSYGNKRHWKCEVCNSLFTNHKTFKLHKERVCNTNIFQNTTNLDKFDILRDLKELFPEVFKILKIQ